MQSTCSSSLQRTLKPKQLLVDVLSLSSYVHSATGWRLYTVTDSVNAASQFKSLCQDLPRLLELFLGGSKSVESQIYGRVHSGERSVS